MMQYLAAVKKTKNDQTYGFFRVKGVSRTLFRFTFEQGEVAVKRHNPALLLYDEFGYESEEAKIQIPDYRAMAYEKEIARAIDEGKTKAWDDLLP